MFYEKQPKEQQENYKLMLKIIGSLTKLFSDSKSPYLPYRVQENVFCKYFEAENLARSDNSADAKKEKFGIGLKTWVGNDDQKVAEFDSLREQYATLTGIKLAKKISEYRNERIRVTKNLYDIDTLIYHIVKRVPNAMQILEHSFDLIDIDNISLIRKGNKNNTYFTDGKHTYHFSLSKNTLYMIFDDMVLLDSFDVEILDDPYSYLMNLTVPTQIETPIPFVESVELDTSNKVCLRLYSVKKGKKFVPDRSGLNQWNALGRKRDANEIYIPFPSKDRNRFRDFFPSRNTSFKLILPNGREISAKVCQQDDKAIMSNPNKELGEWLLRKVFEIKEKTLVTYDMLELFGIDSVVFTKIEDLKYKVDFAEIGTYEAFYGENK